MGEEKKEIEITLPSIETLKKSRIAKYLPGILLISIFFLSLWVRLTTFDEPYLLAADSFHWHRYVKWIISGNLPEHDYLWTFPEFPKKNFIYPLTVPLTAYTYLFIGKYFFNLEKWCFFFNALLASLCVFPVYFIGKTLKNWVAGSFASFLCALSPAFLARSMAGFFDTDALNMLLTATVVCLFIYAYMNVEEKKIWNKKVIVFSSLAGIALALFNLQWSGWWYVFYLLLSVFIVHLLYNLFLHRKIRKFFISHILLYLILFASFLAIVLPIRGFGYLVGIPKQPLSMIPGTEQYFWRTSTIFPNVWISISEEQRPSNLYRDVVLRIGIVPVILCIFGFFAMGYEFLNNTRKYSIPLFLLIFWLIATGYACFQAVRFTELLSLPISICAGIFMGYLYEWWSKENGRKRV